MLQDIRFKWWWEERPSPVLTQIITYISNISWQQRRSKKRKTMPHSSSWTQNAAGDTKILKVESPEISPTSARNNRRQDEGSSWGKSLKLLNITPRLFEEWSILSFVGSHQWTSPSFKASESSFSPPPRSHRPSDERPIEVDSTAGINKAAADSLISLEPIFLMYCILNIWSDIHIDAVRIDLVALRLKGGGLLIDSEGLKIPQPSYSSFNGDSSFPSKSISINSLRGRGWRRRRRWCWWCWWGDGCRHC